MLSGVMKAAYKIIVSGFCLWAVLILSFRSFSSSPVQKLPEIRAIEKAKIFYNMFIEQERDFERVESLFQEQISFLNDSIHGEVAILSIGYPFRNTSPSARIIKHLSQGDEILTLQELWNYCQNNPSSKVIYLHSKGSFHASSRNDLLRIFITKGALSEECFHLSTDCNMCSSRMSPFPHLHSPGNMWLARCSYIRKLLPPANFSVIMGENPDYCIGSGRFAAEHWVHAHPDNKPCDLYTNSSYTWSYDGIPTLEEFTSSISLAKAPRFEPKIYTKDMCHSRYDGRPVLEEFQRNYNKIPDSDWWGWSWFNLSKPMLETNQ